MNKMNNNYIINHNGAAQGSAGTGIWLHYMERLPSPL